MKRLVLTVVALAVIGVVSAPCRAADNKLPKEAAAVLAKATEIEIISLEPSLVKVEEKDTFHGYKALGKTVVKDKAGRTLTESLVKGMDGQIDPASCFNPRHGLRATVDGKTVDLVVCFQCHQLDVFFGAAEKGERLLINKNPEPALDKVLKDAGVPKAK